MQSSLPVLTLTLGLGGDAFHNTVSLVICSKTVPDTALHKESNDCFATSFISLARFQRLQSNEATKYNAQLATDIVQQCLISYEGLILLCMHNIVVHE